jgi:hypothetical protein
MDKYAYNCINLNGASEASLTEYSKQVESLLKMGFIGATKRAAVTASTKPSFEQTNDNLIAEMKTTMLSMQKAITTPTNDGW